MKPPPHPTALELRDLRGLTPGVAVALGISPRALSLGLGSGSEDVVARAYGETIYACAYIVDAAGNEYYSEVFNMSPENYAQGRVENSSNANMVAVAKALVVYGEAAKAYLNK